MPVSVRIRRVAIRCAYLGLRTYWFLTRPQLTGVKCVVSHGDEVVLVRHTYGNRSWDLPGGTVRRRERPLHAARREMEEELGRLIEDWTDLGELFVTTNNHGDNLHLFHGRLGDRRLEIDLGELDQAAWFPHDRLPPDATRFVRPIVARAIRRS